MPLHAVYAFLLDVVIKWVTEDPFDTFFVSGFNDFDQVQENLKVLYRQ